MFFKSEKKETAEPRKLMRPRIGLALGAGVARGWTHIGVIKAMEKHGIKPDMVAGTSIGAVVGGAFVSGGLERLEKWSKNLSKINFFRFLDFKIRGGGLFGAEKLTKVMKDSFGNKNFSELKIPFIAVGCDIMTGHEIWMKEGRMVDAIQASFALPGIFEPVDYQGKWLVDGALVNPVPVSVCRAMGADLVIAINLSEDIYGKARAKREGIVGTGTYGVFSELALKPVKKNTTMSKTIIRQLLGHKRGAPSLFANMVASLNIVQNRLSRSRLAGDPPDIQISPKCGHIGLMEFHRAEEMIKIGEAAFEKELETIKDALHILGHKMNI
ncbi:MAG: patatin-like phospholipase family protein [Sphingomonadales bacterium]